MKTLAFIDKEVTSKYSNYRHLIDYCPDLPRAYHNDELCKALKENYYVRDSSFFNTHWLDKYSPDIIITNIADKPHVTEFEIDNCPSDEELESYAPEYFFHKGGFCDIRGYQRSNPEILIIAYTDKTCWPQFTSDFMKEYGISHLIHRPEVYEGIETVLNEFRRVLK